MKLSKNSELDGVLDQILDLQDRQAETQKKLEETKQDLQSQIEEEIKAGKEVHGGGRKLSAMIVELEAECAALETIVEKKKKEAAQIMKKERPQREKRIKEIERNIEETKRRRDLDFVRTVAGFCHEWDLNCEWSKGGNKGYIGVPVLSISSDEIKGVEDRIRGKGKPVKKEDQELEELRKELLKLEMLDDLPSVAVESALMYRRKGV